MSAISGPYTATLYDYVRNELKFETDLPYEVLTPKSWPWSYAEFENKFVNVAENPAQGHVEQPSAQGARCPMAIMTSPLPTRQPAYTFAHMGLDKSLRGNIA